MSYACACLLASLFPAIPSSLGAFLPFPPKTLPDGIFGGRARKRKSNGRTLFSDVHEGGKDIFGGGGADLFPSVEEKKEGIGRTNSGRLLFRSRLGGGGHPGASSTFGLRKQQLLRPNDNSIYQISATDSPQISSEEISAIFPLTKLERRPCRAEISRWLSHPIGAAYKCSTNQRAC